jgi:hypothetical protein
MMDEWGSDCIPEEMSPYFAEGTEEGHDMLCMACMRLRLRVQPECERDTSPLCRPTLFARHCCCNQAYARGRGNLPACLHVKRR